MSYEEERIKALTSLDLDWVRTKLGGNLSDEYVLLHTHKARYECTRVDPVLREESREYLEKNGYSRVGGIPFPPKGVLP